MIFIMTSQSSDLKLMDLDLSVEVCDDLVMKYGTKALEFPVCVQFNASGRILQKEPPPLFLIELLSYS